MAGKINGEGVKGPIPVIQAPGEYITCTKCGQRKIQFKKDFPYCYKCYEEMLEAGEITE